MKQANGHAWMYEQMVATAKRWSNALNILAGVLGALLGTSGLVSIFTDRQRALWLKILEAIVGYLIMVISVLNSTWRLDATQSNALVAQVSFASLGQSILYQLALEPSERQNAHEFIERTLAEVNTMKLSSPVIYSSAKKAYIARFRDNPIFNPRDALASFQPPEFAQSPDVADSSAGDRFGGTESSDDSLGGEENSCEFLAERFDRETLEKMIASLDGSSND